MASFDRFDVCEAYAILESDYNVDGWLRERPSNQRRRESCGVQLHRIQFRPGMGLSFDNMNENGQEIYLSAVLRWKLPIDEEQHARLVTMFGDDYRDINWSTQ
jgi:hypothetical protein